MITLKEVQDHYNELAINERFNILLEIDQAVKSALEKEEPNFMQNNSSLRGRGYSVNFKLEDKSMNATSPYKFESVGSFAIWDSDDDEQEIRKFEAVVEIDLSVPCLEAHVYTH